MTGARRPYRAIGATGGRANCGYRRRLEVGTASLIAMSREATVPRMTARGWSHRLQRGLVLVGALLTASACGPDDNQSGNSSISVASDLVTTINALPTVSVTDAVESSPDASARTTTPPPTTTGPTATTRVTTSEAATKEFCDVFDVGLVAGPEVARVSEALSAGGLSETEFNDALASYEAFYATAADAPERMRALAPAELSEHIEALAMYFEVILEAAATSSELTFAFHASAAGDSEPAAQLEERVNSATDRASATPGLGPASAAFDAWYSQHCV